MMNVLLITTGYSSLVTWLTEESACTVCGIVDCGFSKRLKFFSEQNCIPYRIFEKQDQTFLEWVQNTNADLAVVYRMPFLIKEDIISIFQEGVINLHPSLLPAYRGPNPWYWIFRDGVKESGITLHRLDQYEDSGTIISVSHFQIPFGAELEEMRQLATEHGWNLLKQYICQPRSIIPYRNPIKNRFRARHINIATEDPGWNILTAKRLWHLIHAFPAVISSHPLLQPGRYIPIEWKVCIGIQPEKPFPYGQDLIVIPCNNGYVKIQKV